MGSGQGRVRVGVRVRVMVVVRVSQGLNWLLPKRVVRIAYCSGRSHVLLNRAFVLNKRAEEETKTNLDV